MTLALTLTDPRGGQLSEYWHSRTYSFPDISLSMTNIREGKCPGKYVQGKCPDAQAPMG